MKMKERVKDMFKNEKKYNVVMNVTVNDTWQTDLLFATDNKDEAISTAKSFNDKDVEIWTDIDDEAGSYNTIEF